MTREIFTPSPIYTIATAGPHPITHPYQVDTEIAATIFNGVTIVELVNGVDFTVAPSSSETTGDVTLSAAAFAAYTGAKLLLRRVSVADQGWAGQTAREKGLEAQLDGLTQRLQEVDEAVARSFKIPNGTIAEMPLNYASTYPFFDANQDLTMAAGITGVPATPYMATLLDDADAKTARETLGNFNSLAALLSNPALTTTNTSFGDIFKGGDLDYQVAAAAADELTVGGVNLWEYGVKFTSLARFKAAIARGNSYKIGETLLVAGAVYTYLGDGNTNIVGLAGWEVLDFPIVSPLALIRAIPSAFTWAGIVPKICLGVGNAQPSEDVSEYARRAHSGLIGSGEVWVDPINGLDTNSGSVSSPVKTLAYAVRTLSPSQIYAMAGTYEKFEFRSTDTPGAKLKIVTALGPCYVREAADDAAAATWTSDTTYPLSWWMPLTGANKPPVALLDSAALDLEGQPRSLAAYTSLALLNAMASGSGYYYDSAAARLYVRYFSADVNTVKTQLRLITGDATSRCLIYGAKILLEGDWHFEGVFLTQLDLSGVQSHVYFDTGKTKPATPTISHTISHGLDALGAITYLQNVWVHRTKGDNLHYTDSGGFGCDAVEINCLSTYAGDIDGNPAAANTANGSSIHGSSNVLRINGEYRRNYGPDVVDTGTGESWNIGSVAGPDGNSGNDFGFYTTGPVMRLDCCAARGQGNYDISAITGGVMKLFSTSYRTSDATGGTIENYDPSL